MVIIVSFICNTDIREQSEEKVKVTDLISTAEPIVIGREEKVDTQAVDHFCFGKNRKVQIDKDGNKWFNGARVFDEGPGDAFLDGKKINEPPPFLFKSERMIADLIRHPIGMPMPAAPNYAVDWDSDFVQSLMHTIEIKPSDSEEVKQLKRDVIEAKKDIVKIIKSGGTFSDVIMQSQKEANRVAGIRNEMVRIYSEMKKEGASPQELKDHIDAANILLKKEGAIPLPLSHFLEMELEEN